MTRLADSTDTTTIRYWTDRARAWAKELRQTPMARHEQRAAWAEAFKRLLMRLRR